MHLFFTLFPQRLPNHSLNNKFFQTPPLPDAVIGPIGLILI